MPAMQESFTANSPVQSPLCPAPTPGVARQKDWPAPTGMKKGRHTRSPVHRDLDVQGLARHDRQRRRRLGAQLQVPSVVPQPSAQVGDLGSGGLRSTTARGY